MGSGMSAMTEANKRKFTVDASGIDIVDDLFTRIDELKKNRDAKVKADQDYRIAVENANINAQYKGVGRVVHDPATNAPKLMPFTDAERATMLGAKAQANVQAMTNNPFMAPLIAGLSQQVSASAPPAAAVPSGPVSIPVHQVAASPTPSATLDSDLAANPPTAKQRLATAVDSAPFVQLPGLPYGMKGFTVNSKGEIGFSYEHLTKLQQQALKAAGAPLSVVELGALVDTQMTIKSLRTLASMIESGKFKTGPLYYKGALKYQSLPVFSNLALQSSPNSEEDVRLVALNRLNTSEYLHQQTGAQRGFPEIAYLLQAMPDISKDTPKNYISKARMLATQLEDKLKSKYDLYKASGYNAAGIADMINNNVEGIYQSMAITGGKSDNQSDANRPVGTIRKVAGKPYRWDGEGWVAQ